MPKNIPILNGIRALAVLVVFLTHATNNYYGGFLGGGGAGQLGVMLFFVLSGLLMGHLYLATPASTEALISFAIKRISRIYPVFVCVVFACYALAKAGWIYDEYYLAVDLFPTLALIRGASLLWTIGPEVIFYGIFLLLWPLWRSYRGWFWAAIFVLLSLTLAPVAMPPVGMTPSNSLVALHHRLPYFLAGMFIGMDLERASTWFGKSFYWMLAVFILSAPQILGHFVTLPELFYADTWGMPIYLVITVMFVLSCLGAQPRLLANRFTEYLGKISFSFYLIHMVVLKSLKFIPSTAGVVASLLVTLALSHAAYKWIELPGQRLGRWLLRYVKPRSTPGSTGPTSTA